MFGLLEDTHNMMTILRHFLRFWICRGGHRPVPARSLDLIPIDYYVWSNEKPGIPTRRCPKCRKIRQLVVNVTEQLKNKWNGKKRVETKNVYLCGK